MAPPIETASSSAKSSAQQVKVIRSSALEKMNGIVHGLSTRLGGYSKEYGGNQLNLGFTSSDVRATVESNRQLYLRSVLGRNAVAAPLVTLRQIHSGIVRILRRSDAVPEKPWKGDGIVTNRSGVLLGIQVADCVPVLVADDEGCAIGAFHAGWRGTVKRIVQRGVGAMRALFGCRPESLRAAIGPCIHQCCYAVGDEVIDEFQSQFTYADELFTEVYDRDPIKEKYPLLFLTARAPGHSNIGPQTHLDLVEANRRQLLDAGVPEGQIWSAGECTSCRTDLLFSHRAESGYTGRMMAVIGMK
ncbi:MAG TPA: peptidoglycan editing factor PgeF [Terriglobales bacterium]|nr:peptidoglycan editing factor PgeF [Terriglobales bacterium]